MTGRRTSLASLASIGLRIITSSPASLRGYLITVTKRVVLVISFGVLSILAKAAPSVVRARDILWALVYVRPF